jgi:transcriptional regulator with XRE-family HTH domain
MDFNYVAMGQRIKSARKKKKLTQEQLAELCDLSTAHIGHVERGSRALSIETLVKLALVLDVSTDYLLLDVMADKDTIFEKITISFGDHPKERVERFYNIVKILSDNIDRI